MALCSSYSFNAGGPTDGRKPTIKTGNMSFLYRKNSSSSLSISIIKNCLPQMENLFSTQTNALEQGQSPESITNICSSSDPQDNDNSVISLKLG